MIDERTLSADVYAAIAKVYDRECDIEDSADAVLEIIEADRKRRGVNSTHTLGDPECNHCGGTGDVSGEYPGIACSACAGTGKAPQPAEHNIDYEKLYEQMCNRCDSLDAKLAEYERRGEPVAYRLLRKNADGEWVTDGRPWCDGVPDADLVKDSEKSGQYRIEYAFAAPQPAEPVKEPSDADENAARWQKARTLPRSWWRDAFNRIAAEGVTLDELIDAEMRRKLP